MPPDSPLENPPHASSRVFFALWPSPSASADLHRIGSDFAKRHGGRGLPRENLHITLAFIGDVVPSEMDALRAAAGAVSSAPFSLRFDHFAYWPRHQIYWAGCRQMPPELGDLRQVLVSRLRQRLPRLEAVFVREKRFTPHVTLVRKAGEPALDGPPKACPESRFERFALVRSRLDKRGASYETLADWPLQTLDTSRIGR